MVKNLKPAPSVPTVSAPSVPTVSAPSVPMLSASKSLAPSSTLSPHSRRADTPCAVPSVFGALVEPYHIVLQLLGHAPSCSMDRVAVSMVTPLLVSLAWKADSLWRTDVRADVN